MQVRASIRDNDIIYYRGTPRVLVMMEDINNRAEHCAGKGIGFSPSHRGRRDFFYLFLFLFFDFRVHSLHGRRTL